METSIYAGIIPYTIENGRKYYLLGLKNGEWSGFVGQTRKNELPLDAAMRHFNDQTAMIFRKMYQQVYSKLISVHPIVEKTHSGNPVYIWFIQIEKNDMLNYQINKKFNLNKGYYNITEYFEKQDIEFFSKNEITKINISPRLIRFLN